MGLSPKVKREIGSHQLIQQATSQRSSPPASKKQPNANKRANTRQSIPTQQASIALQYCTCSSRSIVWFSIRNPHIGIRHQMPNGFPTVYPATAFLIRNDNGNYHRRNRDSMTIASLRHGAQVGRRDTPHTAEFRCDFESERERTDECEISGADRIVHALFTQRCSPAPPSPQRGK